MIWSLISTSHSFLFHQWNGWFQVNHWITLSIPNRIVIQRFIWNHSFHRWVLSFFVNTINYCSIGTETIGYCINKETVPFSNDTFLSACRMAFSLIRHRETLPLVNTYKILLRWSSERTPLTIHVGTDWHVSFTYLVGMTPFACWTRETEFLCTRVHISLLLKKSSIFQNLYFPINTRKIIYTFFLTISNPALYSWRAGWSAGNECCPMSTARWINEWAEK